jgi:hypothetical protein
MILDELEVKPADWPIALLGYDNLCHAGPVLRLVVIWPVYERHYIGVLL